jgi:hypothetical protein
LEEEEEDPGRDGGREEYYVIRGGVGWKVLSL